MKPLPLSARRLAMVSLLLAGAATVAAGLAGATAVDALTATLPLPHPKTILLRSPEVHRELKLDNTQQQAIAAMLAPIEHALWKLRDQDQEGRLARAIPLLKQLDERLAAILSDEQRLRFHQVLRQSYGFNSLRLPDVKEQLALTEQQVADLDATLDQHFEQLREINETGQQQADAARELLGRTERALLDRLDAEQQEKLTELIGPTIDLSAVKQVACLAPELRGVDAWLPSTPLTLEGLRGKVVVVHFYTHICINCVRNLPHYNRWNDAFPPDKFQIIGIHRPEFEHDRDPAAILQASKEAGIAYPIAVDNQSQNWDAWVNTMWPSVYLIDKNGYVRSWWYGELTWQGATGDQQMADHIQTLIDE